MSDVATAVPFTSILVPLDGSPLAEAALSPAVELAATLGARVTLLHVLEADAPATVHGAPHLVSATAADLYLHALAERWQGRGAQIATHVHPNLAHDVARGIAEHTAELGADLIALSTHGHSGVRGFLFGSIAQQVLRRSPTPVLLVEPDYAGRPAPPFDLRVMLLPLDGTPDARAALPLAVALAAATQARLHIARVVPTLGTLPTRAAPGASMSPAATSALLDIEQDDARGQLQAILDSQPAQLQITAEVRRGDVAEELDRAAERVDADLVVMSTHGRAGLDGFLTGSTAAKLLSHQDRPMLLLRQPWQSPEPASA
jgi:nucleotide-binding universal stress UspA family protein